MSPEQLPMALDNAMRTALTTSTPTCLIVPHDVQQAEVPEELPQSHGIVPSATTFARPLIVAPPDTVAEAAAVLNDGRRVAVLVGRGAAGAASEIAAVVETLGAGVTTSLLGKPVLDEDAPWHTGVMGHLGTTASAELMADCDTLLIVGSNDPWTEFYPAPGQARAVQIDVQPRVVGSKYPVDVAVIGDAQDALAALLPLLRSAEDRTWQDRVRRSVQRWRAIASARADVEYDGANPEFVIGELSRHLPADVRLAVDVGSATYWYARHLRLPTGADAHVSGYLAAMGCAMPYAIAAKLDAPERPVVALVGDGAMQMSGLLELITVADRWRQWSDPRFVVLVLHNGDLAEVSWEQREMEGDPRFATSQAVPAFPYAHYAELLGLRGIRVTTSAESADAWRAAFAADCPVLIEAIVDPAVPLVPPNMPDEKADKVFHAISGEDDDAPADHLARQRADDQRVSR
jgi:pyruvate dehydrogenase (quinone)